MAQRLDGANIDMTDRKEQWEKVTALNIDESVRLGPIYSEFLLSDPKCFGFVLARYKFAAKMLARKKSILEIGCGEGIGTLMLAGETRADVVGLDFDEAQIQLANQNFKQSFDRFNPAERERLRYTCADFTGDGGNLGRFEGLVSIDVIEHVPSGEDEHRFLTNCVDHLLDDGVAIIGTPNDYASAYASERSQIGHINLFKPDRFVETLEKYFSNVFLMSMNDEMVHTGYDKMAHYLMAVCVK